MPNIRAACNVLGHTGGKSEFRPRTGGTILPGIAYNKVEAKLRLRDKILVYGAVPRANIRATDLGPVIIRHDEALAKADAINSSGFACREMRWGWAAHSLLV